MEQERNLPEALMAKGWVSKNLEGKGAEPAGSLKAKERNLPEALMANDGDRPEAYKRK